MHVCIYACMHPDPTSIAYCLLRQTAVHMCHVMTVQVGPGPPAYSIVIPAGRATRASAYELV